MKEKIIEIKDLEAGYGKLKILNGISLDIERGDLIAVIGPNGSGKSTTLKCIFGLLKPEKGSIVFNGKHLGGKKPDEIVRLGISYVAQGRRVFQTMSVQENLEMGAFTLDEKTAQERIEEVYKKFPVLESKKNQRATFLSGGQQQMLSIARALLLKPEVLLLDEPSLGLDPKTIQEVFSKIKEINKQGTTIILVEQNAKMALRVSSRVCVLRTGKIAFSGARNKASMNTLKKIYFGH